LRFPIQTKLNKLNIEEAELFPWMEQLSNLPDKSAYVQCLLQQPLVWLRLNNNSFEKAKQLLQEHTVPYVVAENNPRCVGVPSATPLDKLTTETCWEIQDYSSQRVLDKVDLANADKVWDCCAASGGKSLLLKEQLNEADFYVSDVRENILLNLHQRFQRNHITRYHYACIDLMQESSHRLFTQKGTGKQTQVNTGYFDTILADVPCTGSGTWARTPEQWTFFDAAKIDTYATKQRTILKQIIPFLSSGGQLIYITCSVFAAENELQVAYLEKELGLKVEHSSVIQGSSQKADTMFVAVLKKI
jgi:16S rRNA (cytosine967-C5)-methyltransferase